jgi:hypothetical protein
VTVQDLMSEVERSRREARLRNMLDLDQFRTAVQTGAFRPITLRAGGIDFWIEGKLRKKPDVEEEEGDLRTLCTSRRRRPRWFRNPAAALQLLREMGATNVEVELGSWHPRQAKELGRKRPDMAERLLRAHRDAKEEAIRKSGFVENAETQDELQVEGVQKRPQEQDFGWPTE